MHLGVHSIWRFRLARVVLDVLLVAALLTGCGQDRAAAAGGRIPIRFFIMFTSTRQAEFYKWAEQTYEKAHPDIDIIVEQFPGTSLKDFEIKLRLRFSSGEAPDLFQAHENMVAGYAFLGLLSEAPPYIEKIVQENSLNDMVRQAPYFRGKCYGIVNDAVWQALYYNKKMFRDAGLDPDHPPETWDQLIDYADRLTVRRPDGSIERAGFSVRKTGYKAGTAEKWFTFLFSAGGRPFSIDGTRATFNSPAGRRALQIYAEMLFRRKVDSVSLEGDQQGFGQGRVAMFLREMHVIRWMDEHYPDVEYGVAPLPRDMYSISSGGSYILTVPKDAPHPEASWRFVQFLMQDDVYARYVSIGGLMPVTRSVASLPRFRDDPYLKVYFEQKVAPMHPFPRIIQASDILGAYIERFCYGQIGAEEMLRRAERDINGLLSRNHKQEEVADAR
ncbi:MAG TPA: ABC transporter substrate-binding protein [Rhodothermales bacterium]|nr:ABC transporter substrate-binding protein [Rhodothermales bacterium]